MRSSERGRENLGACGAQFRDPVLGPGSGQRPMRATAPVWYFCLTKYVASQASTIRIFQ
jgi:hypothetical protein